MFEKLAAKFFENELKIIWNVTRSFQLSTIGPLRGPTGNLNFFDRDPGWQNVGTHQKKRFEKKIIKIYPLE